MLYKQYSGARRAKLAYAFFRMCSNNPNQQRVLTSKQYDRARSAMSSVVGEHHPSYGRKLTSEQKTAISKRQTGSGNSRFGKSPWNKGKKLKPLSPERRQLMSEQRMGYVHSQQTKDKISNATRGKSKTLEHRKKISNALKGKRRSIESVEKSANARRGRKPKQIVCPNCGQQGAVSVMKRWHFENCKQLKT